LEYLSLLIIPLAGAIIGYSTNLLAITMLFRPHSEIRLLGCRLPFTPGLVPRRQRQLAEKMGASLAENILTSQALVEAASNSKIIDNMVNIAQDFVDNIVTGDEAISKILADALKRDEDELIQGLIQNSEKLAGGLIKAGREYAENKALPYLQSEDFAWMLTDFAKISLANAENSGKKLSDIIPVGAVAVIKSAAKDNMHRLAPLCRKFLADDRVDARLRELVGKIAKENATGILGLFVNGDKIYNSIVQNLLKYLEDDQNHGLICEKLDEFIDNVMDKELGWLISKMNREQIENWSASAVATIQKNLQQDNGRYINKIFDSISRSISPEKVIRSLLSVSPSRVFPNKADHKATVDKLVRNAVSALTQKASEYIVNALDIAKIAEERINAFESREMERLVKTVAGVHLKWIVRLGGLLGFIMGFFPAVFNLVF
jgi:uncharacterized membrane protein YheB (UPF0754 family)